MAARVGQPGWTTPSDLREQVRRLWKRGAVLRGLAGGEGVFPRRLVLRRPTAAELLGRFAEVRSWARSLQRLSQVRLVLREVGKRSLGANSLPAQAWIDGPDEAAALIGRTRELREFRRLVEETRPSQPALVGWLARRPVRALALGSEWSGLLGVVQWLQEHPRPGVYVREMDVPGVDTKFVRRHRGVLGELLDIAMPPAAIDRSRAGVRNFESRYGFKARPVHVRFRILDPACAVLPWDACEDGQDIAMRAGSFAVLRVPVTRVFVVENEVNFLSLPPMSGTLAIFGAGYGFEMLAGARWLRGCEMHYWGDIDTHGFAILDELRAAFERAESFLMDRSTLMEFERLWVREPTQARGDLSRLTAEERELYDDLRYDRLGPSVRLEQERIAFSWVRGALAGLGPAPAHG